eukprot:TRINITY_DN25594_c0_g1_i1.p1 TRINITY_DN25594_c0_g1~~TRINITY_DN25594_c0_g1_i1.p1  ORF type:complete len:363 (+),score=123.83 TRINITY_DN25594_c0_g1_i1:75-1091(+)
MHEADAWFLCGVVLLIAVLVYRLRSDFRKRRVVQDWDQDVVYLITVETPPEWRPADEARAGTLPFCPDARCLAVESWLRLAGVRYRALASNNSRAASPTHALPFIELNGEQHVDPWVIFRAVAATQEERGEADPGAQRCLAAVGSCGAAPWDVHAATALVDNLYHCMERQRWLVDENYQYVVETFFHWAPRSVRSFGAFYKRREVARTCWANGVMGLRRREDFLERVDHHLAAVEHMLRAITDTHRAVPSVETDVEPMQKWIDGREHPGAVDCVVYAHLKQFLDDPLPSPLAPQFADRFPHCAAFARSFERLLAELPRLGGGSPSRGSARAPSVRRAQ